VPSSSLPDPGTGDIAPAVTEAPLTRGIGLLAATSLNVTNMVGIGPFITIPVFMSHMGGPQALVAWVIAAVVVVCDGLVWCELAAAFPGSGGTYHFFRRAYAGTPGAGLMPFLYIWTFLASGALELASGYIGIAMYLEYVLKQLAPATVAGADASDAGGISITMTRVFMALCALGISAVLMRRIGDLGKMAIVLWAGSMATVIAVIAAGMAHFQPELLEIPPEAFRADKAFFTGLGLAMLVAIYDYFGYYNVCYLGDEVRDPSRTLPRSVLLSIAIVATVYFGMNLCIIGVIPWQEVVKSDYIGSEFMERLFGTGVAVAFTFMILWTAIACLFSMTLGYSRIPFAAARNGDFLPVFARLHPVKKYPYVSLAFLGVASASLCFFDLGEVITGAVSLRILVQHVGQIAALDRVRKLRRDVVLPFRMRLYPLPILIAHAGWMFALWSAGWLWGLVAYGMTALGCVVYWVWKGRRR
jgi:APA family basic amino acid/polyamine antiporter